MKSNKKIVKILEIFGVLLIALSFICNELELFPLIMLLVMAIIGLILCIPESIFFYKNQMKKKEEIASYWKYKILAIPICLIGLLICLFYEISKL
jgi:hypothetical protein